MNILNAVEQEAFESAPVFNSFQRKQYFDFPQAIQQATANLRTPANQLCLLLSCGYFKASKRFFSARTFHPRDVEHVVGRTGLRLEHGGLERGLVAGILPKSVNYVSSAPLASALWIATNGQATPEAALREAETTMRRQ